MAIETLSFDIADELHDDEALATISTRRWRRAIRPISLGKVAAASRSE